MSRQGNILDPIHAELDARVWNNPAAEKPVLKPVHAHWIKSQVYKTLEDGGYTDVEKWLTLVLTGSLTTYQYSDDSDTDISLFVDTKVFPEWSRAEMIALMVEKLDGVLLPGTPHPLQDFVVGEGIKPSDLYKPGLRSGYNLDNNKWIVPPERGRAHDVKAEQGGFYAWGLQMADKMERLLKYEPEQAIAFWHSIHKKRQRDMVKGKGDFCLAPDTLVLTSEFEWKSIGSLAAGDELVGFDEEVKTTSKDGSTRGQQRTFQRSRVTSVDRKTLPSYRIYTDKQLPITASSNHKWLVRGPKETVVWRDTQDLVRGDKIIRFGKPWTKVEVNSNAAHYLAGLFDGEGHITKLGRLQFAQKGGSVLERGCECLDTLGFGYSRTKKNEQRGVYDTAYSVQVFGGVAEAMRFLYQVPTVRLRQNYPDFWVGRQISPKGRYLEEDVCIATVERIEDVGNETVIAIGTSTKTLIAEGLYSHNSESNIIYKMLAQRGLFPALSDVSGEYIASNGTPYDSSGTVGRTSLPRLEASPDDSESISSSWSLPLSSGKQRKFATIMYHVAPQNVREEIERHGITKGSVTESPLEAHTFAEHYRTVTPQPYDTWQVDTSGLQFQPDEDYTSAGIPGTWAVSEPIHPSRLRLFPEISQASGEYIAKIGMAETSGFPELDQHVDEYIRAHPELQDLRKPANAWGRCEEVSEGLANHLKEHGYNAYCTSDELGAFGYKGNQKTEDIGAGDFTYPEHSAVEVYGLYGPNDIRNVTIDLTAAQYGHTGEWPKVHGGPSEITAGAPVKPPHLRQGTPTKNCLSCRMYHDNHGGKGKCWGYGEYKVNADQLCDSYQKETRGILGKTAARVLYNKFNPDPVHPRGGNKEPILPFIYDPQEDVVHLGPANAWHWQLLQRTPELRDAYEGEWDQPAWQATDLKHVHGNMEWPSKDITFFNGEPEQQEGIIQALGGQRTKRTWDFEAKVDLNQVAQRIYESVKNGTGSTLNLHGESPHTRYGFAPDLATQTPISLETFSPKDVLDFIGRFSDRLANPEKFVGSWVQGDQVILDVSEGHDSYDTAFQRSWDGHQRAFYDSVAKEDLPARGFDYEQPVTGM